LRRWLPSIVQVRPFSRVNREWWAGVVETLISAILLLVGVVLLALSLTLAVLYSTPDGLYISIGHFVLQLLVAIVLISIGAYRITWLLWKVGVSVERRGAIVSGAGEIELLNEIRKRREDLPTVPSDRFAVQPGERFRFRLTPSPRNVWGLITAGIFTIGFLAISTILISTTVADWRHGENDWLAIGVTLPILLAAGWSIYQFFRQLLKLTGIGPTTIEVSDYPLLPASRVRVSLSQTGRVRLRLLEVVLECVEEATFHQGTDVRTEQATVFQQRLFRQRGISLAPGKPFETNFDAQLPAHGMHSFKSANNRIQWRFTITAGAKKWPVLTRRFTIAVHPLNDATPRSSNRGRL
jgi:hypothetical protein